MNDSEPYQLTVHSKFSDSYGVYFRTDVVGITREDKHFDACLVEQGLDLTDVRAHPFFFKRQKKKNHVSSFSKKQNRTSRHQRVGKRG